MRNPYEISKGSKLEKNGNELRRAKQKKQGWQLDPTQTWKV